jgi:hypothetical protein
MTDPTDRIDGTSFVSKENGVVALFTYFFAAAKK